MLINVPLGFPRGLGGCGDQEEELTLNGHILAPITC